ncbi:tyrosine-protein phosphatase [uncultured Sphingomonas sp.]|uniref:tyrosine-protein phosphatase n=1 Tax=uncultured Sphingomonas sp. TaxID=158754 RepID=UPI00260CABFA|nr:tyrosine-protein phosphatase [uncultured Sphingomonas sp.]
MKRRILCLLASTLVATASVPPVHAAPAAQAPANVNNSRRVVALLGGQNFRDLGGYRTRDGRLVKWGLIYRSGAMNAFTPADFSILQQRRIGEVFDLRSSDERRQSPVTWPTGYRPVVQATNYRLNLGGIMAAIADPNLTDAAALDLEKRFYADLPYQFAAQYRTLFQTLLRNPGPVVFNCSAGKDRTGVAAALLLTALGVPRDVVTADYLLSNQTFDPTRTLATDVRADAAARRSASAGSPLARLLMTVDARLLDAAFAGIDARSGSFEAYLRDELGVGAADVARLRTLYLTRA